jgi:hypothetical protein
METILGGLAFAGLIAAQFLAVVAVHGMKQAGKAVSDNSGDARARHIWRLGS